MAVAACVAIVVAVTVAVIAVVAIAVVVNGVVVTVAEVAAVVHLPNDRLPSPRRELLYRARCELSVFMAN